MAKCNPVIGQICSFLDHFSLCDPTKPPPTFLLVSVPTEVYWFAPTVCNVHHSVTVSINKIPHSFPDQWKSKRLKLECIHNQCMRLDVPEYLNCYCRLEVDKWKKTWCTVMYRYTDIIVLPTACLLLRRMHFSHQMVLFYKISCKFTQLQYSGAFSQCQCTTAQNTMLIVVLFLSPLYIVLPVKL